MTNFSSPLDPRREVEGADCRKRVNRPMACMVDTGERHVFDARGCLAHKALTKMPGDGQICHEKMEFVGSIASNVIKN